ncbi:MAG: CHASE2 domain-containing protein [Synechococcales bacterium]|nr:CHASE2 domain-containing protein [Synechococcales bacterium]
MTTQTRFRLTVRQIEQVCLFDLMWGDGQQLSATVPYPASIQQHYQDWQRDYLQFYKTMPAAVERSHTPAAALRGRAVGSGRIAPPVDWHAKLVQAEATLLYEFQTWLRSGELFEIRGAIAQASQPSPQTESPDVTVFLTCSPLSLARLPWETWELAGESGGSGTVRLVRSPSNIRAQTGAGRLPQSRRARILAIMGDDTGLNFQADREAVQSLSRVAEIRFVGWQPGQAAAEVKRNICQAIADEDGWDVLFFAGHSNETPITGGELAIAPSTSVTIQEIAPYLETARDRGLQFAIFNSCSGLNIAEALIDLGFSQVAIMREPIHNRVAQEFLVRFLQALAAHRDVQDALIHACQFLKTEKQFTHPSAHLVPSLFCHPGATLFRIPPVGWRHRLRSLLPRRYEAIALAACCTLSLLPAVQDFWLDQRVWAQAVYRQATGQLPEAATPPLVLVQIDEESVSNDPRMEDPRPMDRSYLADIIDRVADQGARVVGVDVLLDRQAQVENDAYLGGVVRDAVADGTWLVFGGLYVPEGEDGVNPNTGIAQPEWSLHGYIEIKIGYQILRQPQEDCRITCPFAFLLALIHSAQTDPALASTVRPQLTSQTDLRTQLVDQVQRAEGSRTLEMFERSRFHPLTLSSYYRLGQPWLAPLMDFSIPPDQAYDRIPAWALLDPDMADQLPDLSDRVVMIAAGGYSEAGVDDHSDLFPLPRAVGYWYRQSPPRARLVQHPDTGDDLPSGTAEEFTGGEGHAYIFHHILNRQWVTPIPMLWMVAIAALAGFSTAQWIAYQQRQQRWTLPRQRAVKLGLLTATGLSGLASLQLYISASVLIPWALPSGLFWVYILRALRRKP